MWKVGYRLNKRKHFILVILILLFIVIFTSNFWSDFKSKDNPSKKYYSKDLETFRKHLHCSQILKRTTKCTNYFSSIASLIYDNKTVNHKYYVEKYIENYNHQTIIDGAKARVAVSYIIHQDPGLFEILFHLIFRPYHSYCIYIDPKTAENVQNAFRSILKCYQEVFINTTIIIVSGTRPIFHGGFSLLNADLTCLELLYHSSRYCIVIIPT